MVSHLLGPSAHRGMSNALEIDSHAHRGFSGSRKRWVCVFLFCVSRLTDALCRVPTMIPLALGYHHHGVEYWQHSSPASSTTTVECEASGEDARCSLSVPSKGVNVAHTNVSCPMPL